ncbi:MAG: thiamine-monophosphate kinase [Sphingobacteriales bacterium]|nr:MAG: thiamine-monophosphate kinase [Sphingobacteriales bacterium]
MIIQHADNEFSLITKVAGVFPRHPSQLNQLFEADGEIISCSSQKINYLVAKTDSIQEEISTGLYKDPYLIGWMAVTVSLSDLAASGADPIGVLLALQLPHAYEEGWLTRFQKGVREACDLYQTFIIGGDTNFTDIISITSTSIGTSEKPLLRKRINEGDLLYSTGPLGIGNSFGYSVLLDQFPTFSYAPVARLKESKIIREFATACIDTSEGFFPALSLLATINNLGFNIKVDLEKVLCPDSYKLFLKKALPPWVFLAGPHGEYELVFTISPSRKTTFENACTVDGWNPILLGEATKSQFLRFVSAGVTIACEPPEIANIYGSSNGNVRHYLQLLLQKHQQWSTKNTAFYANKTS